MARSKGIAHNGPLPREAVFPVDPGSYALHLTLAEPARLAVFPVDPGSYAMHLTLAKPARLAVGRLGMFDFRAGQYLYLGSAHGPGGLRGRLAHHMRPAEHPHWHIDYLRALAEVRQLWWAVGNESLECIWSRAFNGLPGVTWPAPGFGASDCRVGCASHLVGLGENVTIEEIFNVLTRAAPALLARGWATE